MSDDHRRWKDSIIGRLIDAWPAIIGIGSFIYTVGKAQTILSVLADSSAKSIIFQEQQITINTRLQTLIDTYDNRMNKIESWRERMDRWNK